MDGLNKRLDIEGKITSETDDFFSKAAFDNRNEENSGEQNKYSCPHGLFNTEKKK